MVKRTITSQDLAKLSIGNAAGLVNSMPEIIHACELNGMTEVTIGPITQEFRPGNYGTTYAYDPMSRNSANSRGLPNQGWQWYRDHFDEIRALAHRHNKRLRASIVGFSPDGYAGIAQRARYAGVDEIEINLGCPNVWSKDGVQKPIISYDSVATNDVLSAVRSGIGTGIPIAVKISPVPDETLPDLVESIVACDIVKKVVAVNTLPHTRLIIDGKSTLRFKPAGASEESPWLEAGGGGGAMLRFHRQRVVTYLANHLPVEMKIIAVGGIFDGKDVMEALQAGAHGFQIGTAWAEFDGPRAIDGILSELSELVSD
jgi:dihydroorotate dehydrogenase